MNVWYDTNLDARRRLLERSCRMGEFTSVELLVRSQPILPNRSYGPREERSMLKIACQR